MIGDMMAFIQYTMQIMMSFLMVSMIFIILPRAGVSAKRIMEIIPNMQLLPVLLLLLVKLIPRCQEWATWLVY